MEQAVVIIGAGITGLSCAFRLKQLGIDTVVLESSSRVGGVIQSERVGEYLIEHGPNSLLPSTSSLALLQECGLSTQLVQAELRAPRYVCVHGDLKKVPFGPLSVFGFARALGEPFVRSLSRDDESIHDFFLRRLGSQIEQRLVSPFVTGVYAGNTRELSVAAAFPSLVEIERRYGSLIIGMLRSRKLKAPGVGRICSFKDGMETLPLGLARNCNVVLEAGPISIQRERDVTWSKDHVRASAIAITAPAYRAAELLAGQSPRVAALLRRIDYAPMVIATTAVPDTAFKQPLRGFGFLIPRSENLHLLGTLFSSCLFPGRSPAGRQLLTSFIGGAFERDAINWDDDRVWEIVVGELHRVLKLSASPDRLRIVRRMSAIPQYKIGHLELISAIQNEMKSMPGVFLAGNYAGGISVSSCIETGERTAQEVAAFVRSRS